MITTKMMMMMITIMIKRIKVLVIFMIINGDVIMISLNHNYD